jgi:hypothetical protein
MACRCSGGRFSIASCNAAAFTESSLEFELRFAGGTEKVSCGCDPK